jgi:CRISPR-associated protein Cas2
MLVIAYDIANDKLRTKFSKYLSKFGRRIQYSIFEIKNSSRLLKQIQIKIEHHFHKKFTQSDSIIVFDLSANCKISKFGYAQNDEKDLLII